MTICCAKSSTKASRPLKPIRVAQLDRVRTGSAKRVLGPLVPPGGTGRGLLCDCFPFPTPGDRQQQRWLAPIGGAPRVHAELRAEGRAVGKKRIARLMRAAGIVGVSRRRGVITTRRDRDARPAPDLVDRNFTAARPNQLWVADITYIPTAAGFLYLAVVLDAFSRRIVGWAMETHLKTELVLAALEMAIGQRKPINVIHHSDQGTQYTSLAFGSRCREAGVRPSIGICR